MENISQTLPMQKPYRYLYNGKELQEDWDVYHYNKRFYDPAIGRFLTMDIIASDLPSLSPYQYASNNPVWCIDLDGLEGVPAQLMDNGIWSTAQDATYSTPIEVQETAHQNVVENDGVAKISISNSKQATIRQANPDGFNKEFLDKQQTMANNQQKINEFIKTGQDLYPTQFGGGEFGFGTNQGLVDGMKEGAALALQLEVTSRAAKGLKTLSKSYRKFSKTTKGQFTGKTHQKLRGAAYKEYKSNFNKKVDIGEKTVNTTIDVLTLGSKVLDVKTADEEKKKE